MVYPSSSPTNTTWLFSSIFVVVFVVSFFSGGGGQPYAKMQLASSRRQRSFLFVVREVLPQRILTWPSIPLFSLDPAVRIEMLQHHLRFEDLFQSFFVCTVTSSFEEASSSLTHFRVFAIYF